MKRKHVSLFYWLGSSLLITSCFLGNHAYASNSFDGSIELEGRYFWEPSLNSTLSNSPLSTKLELEWYKESDNDNNQFIFKPFVRLDSEDNERSHGDIRELAWTHLTDDWSFTLGINKVYWGVTESQHLVDIINQTDLVESIDGEDKLGQPMLQWSGFYDWGTVDAFLLPYFRERTFVGEDGRLNGGIVVDNDQAIYQSSRDQKHLDVALRWSHVVGDWGIGLSWFHGTSREPDLVQFFDSNTSSTVPYYQQIDQFGLDLQLTTESWLWKLESTWRDFSTDNNPLINTDIAEDDFAAITAGFEYTFVGVFNTAYDVGVLSEYSWNDRDQQARPLFQNDLFYGTRIAINDINSSEILFGVVQDLDNSGHISVFAEASTRFATHFTANLEIRYFDADDPEGLLFTLRRDSFIQLGIEYFFD